MFTALPLVAATDMEWGGIHVATWILIAIGVIGIVVIGFKADDRIELRRRWAIRAAVACREIGLPMLAAIFESYAVGDKTAMYSGLRKLAGVLKRAGGPQEIAVLVIEKTIGALLKSPLYGDRVRKAIADATKPAATVPLPPKPIDAPTL
jgi:hypothetical protein